MAAVVSFKCPSCAAPLEAPEGREQFYCTFCGTAVVVPREDSEGEATSERVPRGPVVIPEKLVVHDYGNELTISWRWFTPAVLFLIPFCIAWNAFLVGWYTIGLSGAGPPMGFRIIMLLFPIVHVAVGLGLLYAIAVMLCNSTKVSVKEGRLTLKHGPIPAGKRQELSVDEIDQLYVKQELNTKKFRTADSGLLNYTLRARTKSGREITLLATNSDADIARAVEHLVEKHLGIKDR